MEIKKIEAADSTNTWLTIHEKEVSSPSLVYCHCQTAGRGQRGNSWESEPGKNITASLIFHPKDFPAARQFEISEAVALALVDYLQSKGVKALVKWPNDIYAADKKICGILVEHVVLGKNVTRSIAGFGLNINQKKFLSDAPNPVALTQLTGKEYDIDAEIKEVAAYLKEYIEVLSRENKLHKQFLNSLWRNDGNYYDFHDKLKDEKIKAKINHVGKDGILSLQVENGNIREYAFKEVEYIL